MSKVIRHSTLHAQRRLTIPVLPYGGTSGHSGSDTSRERAEHSDRSGATMRNQNDVLTVLKNAGVAGLNWHEVADQLNQHHGTVSGALSTLHKAGLVSRLKERRNKCAIYVLPEYVDGRTTSAYKPNAAHSRLVGFVHELHDLCVMGDFEMLHKRIQQEYEKLL
jgi:hypothetical protein